MILRLIQRAHGSDCAIRLRNVDSYEKAEERQLLVFEMAALKEIAYLAFTSWTKWEINTSEWPSTCQTLLCKKYMAPAPSCTANGYKWNRKYRPVRQSWRKAQKRTLNNNMVTINTDKIYEVRPQVLKWIAQERNRWRSMSTTARDYELTCLCTDIRQEEEQRNV